MPEKDLFALLGLDCSAGDRQIREAYRRLAKKLHPDVNPGNPTAGEQFKEIAHAYWILSDSQRKKAYLDANSWSRSNSTEGKPRHNEPRQSPQSESVDSETQAGKDITIRLHLTLEELSEGVVKKVKIHRRQGCASCEGTGIAGGVKGGLCPACRGGGVVPDFIRANGNGDNGTIPCRKCGGTGVQPMQACSVCEGRGHNLDEVFISVGIPPGSSEKNKVLVKGQGHDGHRGGKAGDLRVIIDQKEHPYLTRHGDDLVYQSHITLTQWLQGCELPVPSLKKSVILKIEPGGLPSGTLKIRGRGMPREGGGFGDLIVKYDLRRPRELNKKQLQLLKRLEATGGFCPNLDSKGWCARKPESEPQD